LISKKPGEESCGNILSGETKNAEEVFLFFENGKGKRGVSASEGQIFLGCVLAGVRGGGYEKEERKKGKRGWKGLMDTGLRR